MPNFTAHKLLEACRAQGCPVCSLEQQDVERYLDRRFYENVNSPAWRNSLRASLGFCHEHAWLAVDKRLGDALGFSIIYRDIVNAILKQLDENSGSAPASPRGATLLRKVPEQARNMVEKVISALTPRKRCPVCQHRDEMTRNTLSVLVKELDSAEMTDALKASDGLCLSHLRMTFELIKDVSAHEKLLSIHRAKIAGLRVELDEFIRKNDYQAIQEGFGREGDAWLRAVRMITGSNKR